MHPDHYHPILLALTDAERNFELHRDSWTGEDSRLYETLRLIRAEVLKRESGHPFPEVNVQADSTRPAANAPSTVLIADDEPEMRSILRMIMNSTADLRVVGETPNGAQAVEAAMRLQPDVILMDVNMPEMDGFEATRYLRRVQPACRVIILTADRMANTPERAASAGAVGLLYKPAGAFEVLRLLREARAGKTYLGELASLRPAGIGYAKSE